MPLSASISGSGSSRSSIFRGATRTAANVFSTMRGSLAQKKNGFAALAMTGLEGYSRAMAEPPTDYEALTNGARVHGSLYRDPAIFAREMEAIWHQGWVYIGHDSE